MLAIIPLSALNRPLTYQQPGKRQEKKSMRMKLSNRMWVNSIWCDTLIHSHRELTTVVQRSKINNNYRANARQIEKST